MILVSIYSKIEFSMSKKIIITEEERNSIKSLYNINEEGGGMLTDLANEILTMFKTGNFGFGNDDSVESEESVPSITTSDDDFYKRVLKCLGAEPTKSNMSFMYAWRQSEGGSAKNNPFNTTLKLPGSTKYRNNTHGVQNYKTYEDGVTATCKTLINGRDKYGYNKIIDGLKNNVGITKLSDAVVNSKWGTTDLLKKVVQGYVDGNSPKPHPISQTEIV